MTGKKCDEVLNQAMKQYVENTEDEVKSFVEDEAKVEFSDRYKRRINRLFREQLGTKRAMHPEVDNWYKRTRSGIVRIVLVVTDKIKKVFKRGNPT